MTARPFSDMLMAGPDGTGVLWAINRHVFHPRGFALALHIDDDGKATGWSVMGDGTESWTFTPEDDDACFAKFEQFLHDLSAAVVAADSSASPGAVESAATRASGLSTAEVTPHPVASETQGKATTDASPAPTNTGRRP